MPVLNEEEAVGLFTNTFFEKVGHLPYRFEIVFVDDGSTDATAETIEALHQSDDRIKLIQLSRNFGKEAALTAGLERATGDAVIPMDVDLQDPPEIIETFVRLWEEGYDIVFGKRKARIQDTAAKRLTAGAFYKIFNAIAASQIEENVGDFRLMDRRVVEAVLCLRERNRFMKGIFAWVGFKSTEVLYERPARQAGTTKFNFWKLWNFALDGLTGFSTLPLRVWTYVGAGIGAFSLLCMVLIVGKTLIFGDPVRGYPSLMAAILFLGGVQIFTLGIIGEYLARLYIEVKQRPLYLVSKRLGALHDGRDGSE